MNRQNMRKLHLFFVIILVQVFFSGLFGDILQGKLVRMGVKGMIPAPYVQISLYKTKRESGRTKAGKKIATTLSDQIGIYIFDNVKPGEYLVEIEEDPVKVWKGRHKLVIPDTINNMMKLENDESNIAKYKSNAINDTENVEAKQILINIKPILIHDLEFSEPRERQRILSGFFIKPHGKCEKLPNDYYLWILFSDKFDKFYLLNLPVKLHDDGTWDTPGLPFPSNVSYIHAVVLKKEDYEAFKRKVKKWKYDPVITLPENSFIIATQSICIVEK